MAKDPAFLFYSSDFITGTDLMSYDQIGKYIKLLCLQHQKGHLKEKVMLQICGEYDEEIFEKFVKDEQGLFYNERLQEEIDKRKSFCESRRNNRLGKTKEKQVKNTSNSYAGRMENENEDVIVNKDINTLNTIFSDADKTETQEITPEDKVVRDIFDAYPKVSDQKQTLIEIARAVNRHKGTDILPLVKRVVGSTEIRFLPKPVNFFRDDEFLTGANMVRKRPKYLSEKLAEERNK